MIMINIISDMGCEISYSWPACKYQNGLLHNYKFWSVTPQCLFSRDVISSPHVVTRLRSCRYPFCCHVTLNIEARSRSRYLQF